MSFPPEELREILGVYRAESEEHVERLTAGLLRLEQSPRRAELLEEVFREAHSLKGAARMIGFTAVERIAHGLEDLFSLARKGELEPGRAVVDAVLAALDAVTRITEGWLRDPEAPSPPVDDVLAPLREMCGPGEAAAPTPPAAAAPAVEEAGGSAAGTGRVERRKSVDGAGVIADGEAAGNRMAPARPVPPAAEAASAAGGGLRQIEETVRVTTQKLDDLMNQIGEILAARFKLEARLAEIRGIEGEAELLQRAWAAARGVRGGAAPGEGPARELTERIERLLGESRGLAARFGEDTLRMTLASGELQESINRVRMLPLSSLFNLFPRLLRDVALQEGKEVELVVAGGEVQLDKKVIEQLKDPLTHLLRNALDHGIEKTEERVRAGKPPAGRVRLGASQRASSVVIEVEDDGAGIDPERVRAIALRRGFATEEGLRELTEQQLLGLVFRPGFSTKGIITDLSGRGVGLDVVLTNIERLKGTITLASTPGRGSVFSIRLPLTLATAQALFVRVAGQDFAVPLSAVETIDEVDLARVAAVESREAILVDGAPTALVRLHDVLGLPGPAALPAGERA
ncbi:MAG TPA: chemotaxis protein CheA, partial [Candidatus Methanoperedens sp.]|nr:chemotaxis protein CheA [Candidatus Methanoperedens sp.]